MIGKFVTVPACRAVPAILFLATVLAGATMASAQQTPSPTQASDQSQSQAPVEQAPAQAAPAQTQQGQSQQDQTQPAQAPQDQTPPSQPGAAQSPQAQKPADQSSTQEISDEDTPHRKPKPHEYYNWNFNVGGGASVTGGATKTYVRGGGLVGAAGFARNYSQFFGLRVDFQYDNLPLRNSALQLAQAPSGTSYDLAVMADPIINIPVNKIWSGYLVFGPSYIHRGGKLDDSTAKLGLGCNGFWTWWGVCNAGSLPLDKRFFSTNLDEAGYNVGAGVARKLRPNLEIYAEFRYLHGTHSGVTTDFRPITLGVRWGK
jgi:opacity protein-like surface antigen